MVPRKMVPLRLPGQQGVLSMDVSFSVGGSQDFDRQSIELKAGCFYKCSVGTSFAAKLHVWADSSYTIESLRNLQVLTAFSAGMDNANIWKEIWTCLQNLKCELRLHKVPSHEDPDAAADPLAEWALRENGLVDSDGCNETQLVHADLESFFGVEANEKACEELLQVASSGC